MVVCVCGSDCDNCKAFPAPCQGCSRTQGKIFWAQQFLGQDTCSIYDCAVNKKHYTNCGQCSELPCQIFYNIKEPGSTQEEHLKGIERRVNNLKANK